MAPLEAPLRCLAVRAVVDEAGEIDGLELELFMEHVAGPHQWLSTTGSASELVGLERKGNLRDAQAAFLLYSLTSQNLRQGREQRLGG